MDGIVLPVSAPHAEVNQATAAIVKMGEASERTIDKLIQQARAIDQAYKAFSKGVVDTDFLRRAGMDIAAFEKAKEKGLDSAPMTRFQQSLMKLVEYSKLVADGLTKQQQAFVALGNALANYNKDFEAANSKYRVAIHAETALTRAAENRAKALVDLNAKQQTMNSEQLNQAALLQREIDLEKRRAKLLAETSSKFSDQNAQIAALVRRLNAENAERNVLTRTLKQEAEARAKQSVEVQQSLERLAQETRILNEQAAPRNALTTALKQEADTRAKLSPKVQAAYERAAQETRILNEQAAPRNTLTTALKQEADIRAKLSPEVQAAYERAAQETRILNEQAAPRNTLTTALKQEADIRAKLSPEVQAAYERAAQETRTLNEQAAPRNTLTTALKQEADIRAKLSPEVQAAYERAAQETRILNEQAAPRNTLTTALKQEADIRAKLAPEVQAAYERAAQEQRELNALTASRDALTASLKREATFRAQLLPEVQAANEAAARAEIAANNEAAGRNALVAALKKEAETLAQLNPQVQESLDRSARNVAAISKETAMRELRLKLLKEQAMLEAKTSQEGRRLAENNNRLTLEYIRQNAVLKERERLTRLISKASLEQDEIIRNLRRELAELGVVQERVNRHWSSSAQIAAAVRATLAGLGTTFGIYTSATLLAASAAYTLSRAIRSIISEGAEFTLEMARINAVVDLTAHEFDVLREKAIDVSASTQFTATEVASAMREMGMSGMDFSETMVGVTSVLDIAAIGMLDFFEATDIATNIMFGFNLGSEDLARVVDVMAAAVTSANMDVKQMGNTMSYAAPVAQAFGISLELAAAMAAKLADAGIKSSRAGTTMRRALTAMFSESEKAQEEFAALGVYVNAAAENMDEEFLRVMKELNVATNGATENIGHLRQAFDLYALPGMLKLIAISDDSVDSLEALYEKFDQAGGAAREMREKIEDNLKIDWKILSANVSALGQEIFHAAEQPLRKLVQYVNFAIQRLLQESEAADTVGRRLVSAMAAVPSSVASTWLSPLEIFEGVAEAVPGLERAKEAWRQLTELKIPDRPLKELEALSEISERLALSVNKATYSFEKQNEALALDVATRAKALDELQASLKEVEEQISVYTEVENAVGDTGGLLAELQTKHAELSASIADNTQQYEKLVKQLKTRELVETKINISLAENGLKKAQAEISQLERQLTELRENVSQLWADPGRGGIAAWVSNLADLYEKINKTEEGIAELRQTSADLAAQVAAGKRKLSEFDETVKNLDSSSDNLVKKQEKLVAVLKSAGEAADKGKRSIEEYDRELKELHAQSLLQNATTEAQYAGYLKIERQQKAQVAQLKELNAQYVQLRLVQEALSNQPNRSEQETRMLAEVNKALNEYNTALGRLSASQEEYKDALKSRYDIEQKLAAQMKESLIAGGIKIKQASDTVAAEGNIAALQERRIALEGALNDMIKALNSEQAKSPEYIALATAMLKEYNTVVDTLSETIKNNIQRSKEMRETLDELFSTRSNVLSEITGSMGARVDELLFNTERLTTAAENFQTSWHDAAVDISSSVSGISQSVDKLSDSVVSVQGLTLDFSDDFFRELSGISEQVDVVASMLQEATNLKVDLKFGDYLLDTNEIKERTLSFEELKETMAALIPVWENLKTHGSLLFKDSATYAEALNHAVVTFTKSTQDLSTEQVRAANSSTQLAGSMEAVEQKTISAAEAQAKAAAAMGDFNTAVQTQAASIEQLNKLDERFDKLWRAREKLLRELAALRADEQASNSVTEAQYKALQKAEKDYNEVNKSLIDTHKLRLEIEQDLIASGALLEKRYKRTPQELEALSDKYNTVASASRAYKKGLEEINDLLARKEMTPKEYARALREITSALEDAKGPMQSYRDGLKETFDDFERIAVDALDAFRNALIESFEEGKLKLDSFIDFFKRKIAEIAVNRITVMITGMFSGPQLAQAGQVGAGAVGVGGFGGMSGGLPGIGNFFGGTNIGSSLGSGLAWAAGSMGMSGNWIGNAAAGLASTPNWAFGLGGIGGSLLGSMLFGGQAAQIGATLGSAAGSAMGAAFLTPVLGAFGPAGAVIGGLLGGAGGGFLGSLFGGDKKPKQGSWAMSWAGGFEDAVSSQAAFGARVGLSDAGSKNIDAEEYRAAINSMGKLIEAMSNFYGGDLSNKIQETLQQRASTTGGIRRYDLDYDTAVRQMMQEIMQVAADTGDGIAIALRDQMEGVTGTAEEMANALQAAMVEVAKLPALASAMQSLGYELGTTEAAAIKTTASLAKMAGGVENLSSLQQQFYDHFYSDAEKAKIQLDQATAAINQWNAQIGLSGDAMITSSAELRAYVESLDLMTESGQRAYVSALQAASAFIALDQATQSLSGSAGDATNALNGMSMSVKDFIEAIKPEEIKQQEALAEMIALFGSWGMQLPTTSAALYELVAAGALTQRQISKLAGSFDTLQTAWEALAAAQQAAIAKIEANLQSAISAAQSSSAAAIEAITSQYDAMIEAERRSADARIKQIENEYDALLDTLNEQMSEATELVTKFEGAVDSARNAVLDIRKGFLEGPGEIQQDAMVRAQKALADLQAGIVPEDLQDILSGLADVRAEDYASRADYEAALAESLAMAEALQDAAGAQLSEAEQQVKLLEAQIKQAAETRDALIRATRDASEAAIAALEASRQAAIEAEQKRLEAEIAALEAAAEAQKQAIMEQTAQELLLSQEQNALLEDILAQLETMDGLADPATVADDPVVEVLDPLLEETKLFRADFLTFSESYLEEYLRRDQERQEQDNAYYTEASSQAEESVSIQREMLLELSALRAKTAEHSAILTRMDVNFKASLIQIEEQTRIAKDWNQRGLPSDRDGYAGRTTLAVEQIANPTP